jgi:membrane protein
MGVTRPIPRKLSQLHWQTWRGVLVRGARSFVEDDCTDWAAALTYYGVLALFPGAIVVIAVVSLFADGAEAVQTILGMLRELLPTSVMQGVEQPITHMLNEQGTAKALLSVGAVGAVWSASGYVGAFIRASNAIYGVQEGRKWYVLRPLQLGLTIVSILLMAVLALGLVVSGPVARAIGRALRLGATPLDIWQVGKWPLLVVLAGLLLSLLFWIAPNVRQPRLRWLTVGGLVTLPVWFLMSAGFGIYVANFASYDATYGSLGAIVVFLVWFYLSNCALMFGVEINAEVARGRALQAGHSADEPVLPERTPAAVAARAPAPKSRAVTADNEP